MNKTDADNLDADKLKIISKDLKKLGDVLDSQVMKNTKHSTLNIGVNNEEKKKNPETTTLISINQYNTDKQNLQKKNWRCWKNNTRRYWFRDYNCFQHKN